MSKSESENLLMKVLCEIILGKVVTTECSFSIILWVEIFSISPHIIRIQHTDNSDIRHLSLQFVALFLHKLEQKRLCRPHRIIWWCRQNRI